MNDVIAFFKREPFWKQVALICALVVFIAVFFPWMSAGSKYYSVSTSGLHRFGVITLLSSSLFLLSWTFFALGGKIEAPASLKKLTWSTVQLILSIGMFAGALFWMIDLDFDNLGFGVYIALIASILATVAVFLKPKQMSEIIPQPKPDHNKKEEEKK